MKAWQAFKPCTSFIAVLCSSILYNSSKKYPTVGPTFHGPRKKPEYLIARSQLTFHGVRWDSVPFNWWNYGKARPYKMMEIVVATCIAQSVQWDGLKYLVAYVPPSYVTATLGRWSQARWRNDEKTLGFVFCVFFKRIWMRNVLNWCVSFPN